jgi:hypothetical protein
VFREIGPGVAALKRDPAGLHYVLAMPANSVAIYASGDKRTGEIPNANSHGAKIVFAQDFDLDSSGRLYVADRGANAVKVFEGDGSLEATIPVAAPTSVVALPGDEFAVASLRSDRLVSVYGLNGKLVRRFGDLTGSPVPTKSGAALNRGRLYGDPTGQLYFAFTAVPDPTVRKYDRYGFASFEISLPASSFGPPAEPRHWDTVTIEKSGETSQEKPLIGALAVDPETLYLWAAIGDELIEFDNDGNRHAAYRTATADGARIEATAILIEPGRILVAADPLGIFEFARPDKPPGDSAPH